MTLLEKLGIHPSKEGLHDSLRRKVTSREAWGEPETRKFLQREVVFEGRESFLRVPGMKEREFRSEKNGYR